MAWKNIWLHLNKHFTYWITASGNVICVWSTFSKCYHKSRTIFNTRMMFKNLRGQFFNHLWIDAKIVLSPTKRGQFWYVLAWRSTWRILQHPTGRVNNIIIWLILLTILANGQMGCLVFLQPLKSLTLKSSVKLYHKKLLCFC